MIKTWIALALILALCFGGSASFGRAEQEQAVIPVPCAARAFDPASLKGFLSYTINEETGDWSAGADAFLAVLDHAERSGINDLLVMQWKWAGNARTGLVQPLLELYYFSGRKLEPSAISIRVGDQRYDVLVRHEAVKVGSRDAEKISAPLTEQGMALLGALNSADAYSVRLHGKRTCSVDVKRGEKASGTRKKLASASFECLDVAGAIDMKDYRLWDLNAAAWEAAHAFVPRVNVVPLSEPKGFEMLSPGNSGEKVSALQKQLIAQWFLSGGADGVYGERMRESVMRAQKHFGLMETGSADGQLMDCLSGMPRPQTEDSTTEATWLQIGGASLRFDRYWFAGRVEPSAPSVDGGQGHAVGNLDNVFVIFEGEIQNGDRSALSLDGQIAGTLYLDDAPYGCQLLCERDQGTAFDTQLLPQAKSRLIVTAEIPRAAWVAQNLTLSLELSGQSLIFQGVQINEVGN